jgi:hypothetical protein
MIALDSNAMTYWIDAMGSVPGPPVAPCTDEKVTLARIFFWMPTGSCFHYTPTVESEYQAIKDRAQRDNHLSWAIRLISPVWPPPDPTQVEARAADLRTHHSGERDVRIVAECELGDRHVADLRHAASRQVGAEDSALHASAVRILEALGGPKGSQAVARSRPHKSDVGVRLVALVMSLLWTFRTA